MGAYVHGICASEERRYGSSLSLFSSCTKLMGCVFCIPEGETEVGTGTSLDPGLSVTLPQVHGFQALGWRDFARSQMFLPVL